MTENNTQEFGITSWADFKNNKNNQKPKVYGLGDFDMKDHVRETPRSDSALLSPVIESLGLYAQIGAPAKKYAPPVSGENPSATSRNSGTKNIIEDA